MRETSSIPDDFVLLKTTTDGIEAIAVTGLLKANGIEASYVAEEIMSDITGMNEPLPAYKVIVAKRNFSAAQQLLAASHEIAGAEWNEYKQKEEKKGAIIGRVLGIFAAASFYALSLLPMKDSNESTRHLLVGASLFFALITALSFYKRNGRTSK